jgi:hypothetical protein
MSVQTLFRKKYAEMWKQTDPIAYLQNKKTPMVADVASG